MVEILFLDRWFFSCQTKSKFDHFQQNVFTCTLFLPEKGCCPRVKISHSSIPNDQTSLFDVKIPSSIDSGDSHRNGRKSSPCTR